jgi:hypothetical protein
MWVRREKERTQNQERSKSGGILIIPGGVKDNSLLELLGDGIDEGVLGVDEDLVGGMGGDKTTSPGPIQ